MYTNILVPLDGSAVAEAALPYARALADRTDSKLTLIRAAGHTSFFGDSGKDQQRLVARAEEYLEQLGAELARAGFTVETGVPFGGHPAEWIIEESELRRADLIVMASHDRVGVDRWLHGSVAEAVVHAAKAPVMLVKASAASSMADRFASQTPTIAVPLDQSEAAECALPLAIQTATDLRARIVLVSVVPLQTSRAVGSPEALVRYTDADYAQMEADARDYLGTIVKRIEVSGIQAKPVTRLGDAALEIASIAQQVSAAAVVMATHGRVGVVRSMLGSVAGAVVHCGTTPVVLIRPNPSRPAHATQKADTVQAGVFVSLGA
jgi:nucleotide-binding universal stress UspA family protein